MTIGQQPEVTHEAGVQAFLDQFRKDQGFDGWPDRCIQAYLSASGMVLVPREPTVEMKGHGSQRTYQWESELRPSEAGKVFAAMLAAAPDPFKSEAA